MKAEKMKKIGVIVLVMCFWPLTVVSTTHSDFTDNSEEETEEIITQLDDWQYSSDVHVEENRQLAQSAATRQQKRMKVAATQRISSPNPFTSFSSNRTMVGSTPPLMPMATAKFESIGFAVGGAKDTGNFLQNLEMGYLPKYDSITYEGLFYDYYFDTGVGTGSCEELFCPSFASAVTTDLYSGEKNYYLSVGLNSGLTEESFKRKKLNLVVVLDISGSMKSSFDSYHYDKNNSDSKEDSRKSKMQLANESIVAMMQHLHPEDRFGVILFESRAYKAKPLRLVSSTNMEAIGKHILDVTPRGGTNWQAGFKEGLQLFSSIQDITGDPDVYENRIVFLTDAMPNTGELKKEGLFGMVREAAAKGIYSSFIGVGIDFNPELVEYVTKTKGANYFSVQSSAEFKKRLADEFDFMVTPLVFDLELQLESHDYTIEGVYGSPEADITTGEIMKINTLFPSAVEEEQVKGGVVLIKLKRVGKGNTPVKLNVSYTDRNGKVFKVTDTASFSEELGFDNNGIRKAIVLTEYVSLIKNWLIDTNKGCNNQNVQPSFMPFAKCGIVNPENRPEMQMVPIWERRSCKLEVSAGYKAFFTHFNKYFVKEIEKIGDSTLEKECNILDLLIEKRIIENGKNIDDWKGVKQPNAYVR